jgi:hypothetical protein
MVEVHKLPNIILQSCDCVVHLLTIATRVDPSPPNEDIITVNIPPTIKIIIIINCFIFCSCCVFIR